MIEFPSSTENILPDAIVAINPPVDSQNPDILNRIRGSLIGLAVGDALGASVEFRPRQYLIEHPIHDMVGGGTWGLKAGQWTDDTSMALCLASSLIIQKGFNPYDQMVRYKWWYKHGYLSSTGHCFDIGNATRTSLEEFYRRQTQLKKDLKTKIDYEIDRLTFDYIKQIQFDVNCSGAGVAGNGALMRLAPVPLFFYRKPSLAVDLSGQSARLTHGDEVAVDACRYYGALIVAAVRGESKENLLNNQFYNNHREWFGSRTLHDKIILIANGSYKKSGGYEDGIRGKGYIVSALEAALWAFWSANCFEDGALNAVNLGDDTDTTAAIYGQLAGAYYGFEKIPKRWINKLYANRLIVCIADWLEFLGNAEYKSSEEQNANQGTMLSAAQPPQSISPHWPLLEPAHPTVNKNSEQNSRRKPSKPVQRTVLPRIPRASSKSSKVTVSEKPKQLTVNNKCGTRTSLFNAHKGSA